MGQGKKTVPLPAELTPVANIQLLGVFAANAADPLMVADLRSPSALQTIESRLVGYGFLLGYLRVEATLDSGTLRFQVYGLQSGTEYTLYLGDIETQTVVADEKGTVTFVMTLADPSELLSGIEVKVETDSQVDPVFLAVL
jgi:hypothetical protein